MFFIKRKKKIYVFDATIRKKSTYLTLGHVWANVLLEFLLENSPGPLPDRT